MKLDYMEIFSQFYDLYDTIKDIEFEGNEYSYNAVIKKNDFLITRDWVWEVILKLPSIENCINQRREEIKSEENIVSIDKVKKISKESVIHLGKNANLLSDEGSLKPKKLLVLENETEYATYENVFICKTLNLLKDFIFDFLESYQKIEFTYNFDITYKTLDDKIAFHLNQDVNQNEEEFLRPEEYAIIYRIRQVYDEILELLDTDVMKEASTTEISDNIVNTNILRSNKSFSDALDLYDYISKYNNDKYVISNLEEEVEFDTNSKKFFDTLPILLSSISYVTVNNKAEICKEHLNERKALISKNDAISKIEEVIGNDSILKAKYQAPSEYSNYLEAEIKILNEKNSMLERVLQENKELKMALRVLNLEKDAVKYHERNKNYDLYDLRESYETKFDGIEKAVENKIIKLNNIHENEIKSLKDLQDQQLKLIKHEYEENLDKISKQASKARSDAKFLDEKLASYVASSEEKNSKLQMLTEENNRLNALLIGLRQKYNLNNDLNDYTSKESFDELESYYEAFQKFFKDKWKKTKKSIKSDIFGHK